MAAHTGGHRIWGNYRRFLVSSDNAVSLLRLNLSDVSGKDIPAAMFMMQSRPLLKSCVESGMSIEEIFTIANEKFCVGNEDGMFVTACMGPLNVKTGLCKRRPLPLPAASVMQ